MDIICDVLRGRHFYFLHVDKISGEKICYQWTDFRKFCPCILSPVEKFMEEDRASFWSGLQEVKPLYFLVEVYMCFLECLLLTTLTTAIAS